MCKLTFRISTELWSLLCFLKFYRVACHSNVRKDFRTSRFTAIFVHQNKLFQYSNYSSSLYYGTKYAQRFQTTFCRLLFLRSLAFMKCLLMFVLSIFMVYTHDNSGKLVWQSWSNKDTLFQNRFSLLSVFYFVFNNVCNFDNLKVPVVSFFLK